MGRKKQKKRVADSPAKSDALSKRLNRIRGQVDGVDKMIRDGRYCIDIINQIKSIQSALRGLESQVLESHLRACVRSTFESKNAFDVEEKIREIVDLV